MARQLQLNFTPLLVSGDSIRLQSLPFKDAQQLHDLRNEHRTLFAVTRRADETIALPLASDVPLLGKESTVEGRK